MKAEREGGKGEDGAARVDDSKQDKIKLNRADPLRGADDTSYSLSGIPSTGSMGTGSPSVCRRE